MTDEDINNGLQELIQRTESSLIPAVEEHIGSNEFVAKTDGLDFLHVKNSLLISYLIELVLNTRAKTRGNDVNSNRLIELKNALEKVRPLEKKMRYQLEKLLSANSDSTTFASGDPLSFRPNPESLKEDNVENKGISSDDTDDDNDSQVEQEEGSENGDDIDDDLAAAKATIQLANKKSKKITDADEEESKGAYRAPRLAAMPYKPESDYSEKDKRLRRRLRTTELAQALKDQFSEAPEQEDAHGGSTYGKQKEAARRLSQREKEKTDFEESAMIRLTTSRKEKKEQTRMLREESSNLSAISDLGNIVRGVREAFGEEGESRGRNKRRSGNDDFDGDSARAKQSKKRGGVEPKNAYQKALFAGSDTKSKKKKGRR